MNTLKRIAFLLLIVIAFSSCTQNTGQDTGNSIADAVNSDKDTANQNVPANTDTTADPAFLSFEQPKLDLVRRALKLLPVSPKDFDRYSIDSQNTLDSNVFLQAHNLSFTYSAGDIMQSYLLENKTHKRLLLPSSFDEGIRGLRFSPSGDQFMVYSSYDGPGFKEYYEHRFELYIFSLAKDAGISGIQPRLTYYSDDWSVEKAVWINEDSLAFKVFKEEAYIGQHFNYQYFKAGIN